MVVIDKARCTGCGSCAKVCHEHCMSLVDKKITIDDKACSTCTQCVATCPQRRCGGISLESAQYALYNMALVAQARGLGCRNLVGNLIIFNSDGEIRRLLCLKRSERIFAIAGFGYPAVRFRNKVLGRSMNLQWISDGG